MPSPPPTSNPQKGFRLKKVTTPGSAQPRTGVHTVWGAVFSPGGGRLQRVLTGDWPSARYAEGLSRSLERQGARLSVFISDHGRNLKLSGFHPRKDYVSTLYIVRQL